MKEGLFGKKSNVLLIIVNLICILLIAELFINYGYRYHEKLYSQNISSIENLNNSSATVAQAMFSYHSQKTSDIARYIEANNMDTQEALEYLHYMSSNPRESFELIGTDFSGYAVLSDGKEAEVKYSDRSYSGLKELFKKAGAENAGITAYSPEFTDAHTAYKCFAFYTYVKVRNADTYEYRTLMYVSRSQDMMEKIRQNGNFDGLSAVLTDENGNYIIGNPDFKSENFFKYLYVFNNLSLDEMNAVSKNVLSCEKGTLTYKNSSGEKCVFVYARLPNEKWYSISCVPLASFDHQIYGNELTLLVTVLLAAMLVVDILWLNSMNRRLKISVQSEKKANAAKTEFLSRMSHDIRTPLNAILGFTSISMESPGLEPQVKENLSKIETSGRYLLGIINDVLDMAKIESGKVELHTQNADFVKMLEDTVNIFSGEASLKGIELRTEFDTNIHRFLVFDQLRTKQIFSNLLSNAIKFSDKGTVVCWGVRETCDDGKNAKIVSYVADHGCGMSQEFLKKIFEPFSQEENVYSNDTAGTGLGLAIVNRLVSLMNGKVSVKSSIGNGTEFTVMLDFPVGTQYTRQEKTAQDVKNVYAKLNGKRILICEDNALNREIASRLLSSHAVLCDTAENGKKGIEMFAASSEGFYDAILMDIRMPVMTGLEAAKAIRKMNRADADSVPIIAITANAYDEDIRESLACGMNAHLAKPFEPEQLFKTLADLIIDGR